MTTKEKVKAIVDALDEKKGQDIEVLKVEEITTLTEYFVICTATSTTQVKALADNVEFRLRHDWNLEKHHAEGYGSAKWILLDYGFAIVHIFVPEAREFYSLEKLWKDAVKIESSELEIERFGRTR